MLQPILWSSSMFPQKNKLLIFLKIHYLKNNLSIYGKYWELFLFRPLNKSSLKRKKSSYCIFNILRWSFQVHVIHMIENDYWQKVYGEEGSMLISLPLMSKGKWYWWSNKKTNKGRYNNFCKKQQQNNQQSIKEVHHRGRNTQIEFDLLKDVLVLPSILKGDIVGNMLSLMSTQ